ncbi:MAG TPA: hypothetical protein PK281_04765 [Flavobacteriales bacterium]|nr:hypothetical protein [Flavobacteriales bacterium]
MLKKALILTGVSLSATLMAQIPEPVNSYQKSYFATVSEGILSAGNLGKVALYDPTKPIPSNVLDFGDQATPVIRYSTFLHLGEQLHVNFSNTFGFYTGIGMRNIGMINRLSDSVKVKQRVYSVGIPIALKIGNMGKKTYAAFGAEMELFFNYKQKTFKGSSGRGEKVEKFNEWFSKRTELFNPSVFVDFNFGKGSYIKVRYYLNNFLVQTKQNYTLNNVKYGFFPESSQLFALSFGRVIGAKRK